MAKMYNQGEFMKKAKVSEKKRRRTIILSIAFVILILTVLHITIAPKIYLSIKYQVSPFEVKIEKYIPSKFEHEFELFDGATYAYFTTEKWDCYLNGRKFNTEFARFHFVDDYQLEDLFNWCTEYLQENVDENISGIDIGSDIIYRSPDNYRGTTKYYNTLSYSDCKVWSKDDASEIISALNKRDNHITVFLKVDNIDEYKGDEINTYATQKVSGVFKGNENHKKLVNEYTKMINTSFNTDNVELNLVLYSGDSEFARSTQPNIGAESSYSISIKANMPELVI
jgi:hypothetical protein